eukprot:4225508-Prymnesium_polylepis.1
MRRRHTSHRLSRRRRSPLDPPPSDGRRACKPNTGSALPVALRGAASGQVSTDASLTQRCLVRLADDV